jgi:hypothetical protein
MSKELKEMQERFDKAVKVLFGDELKNIDHFNYTERLDMLRVHLNNGDYGDFNLTPNRVSYTGCTCTHEENAKFEMLTHNDEFYNGKLFEIA